MLSFGVQAGVSQFHYLEGEDCMPRLRGRVSLATATAVLLAAGLVAEPSASAQAPVAASGQPRTMIVVLGGSCTPLAATAGAAASCAEQEPVLAQLQAAGATVLSTTSLIDTITASVSPAEAQVLSSIPGVSQVVPDATIPLLQPVVPGQGRFSPPGPGRGPGQVGTVPHPRYAVLSGRPSSTRKPSRRSMRRRPGRSASTAPG